MEYLNNSKSTDTSFFFKPVTSHEVKLEIFSIPKSKLHGLYSCPTQLFKCYYDIISRFIITKYYDIICPVLATFLNKSISLGVCHFKLQMSKMIKLMSSIIVKL